jgi:DNA repair exonuclease SbcCD ATPase subunit
MRVQSIELTNFRCFAGAVVDLPTRVTFLVAKNHYGKSTIIDALRWALTGSCRGTSADGKGSDALIRDAAGVSAMKVAITVDPLDGPSDAFTVERMQNARTSTFAIGGLVGTRHETGTQLADRLGASPAVLAACLDSDAFLDLHHADAKRVLMEILDVHVDVDGERLTLAELDRRYDHWYQERPRRKKALEAVRVPAKPDDGDLPDASSLETKLEQLRAEEKAVIAAHASDSGRRQELERQLAHARSDQARLTSKRLGLETVQGIDLDDAVLALQEAIATRAPSEGEVADAEHARLSLVDAGGRLKLLENTLQAVKTHTPERGCVLNADVECRTPAKEFKKALTSLQEQMTALRTQQDEASKALERGRLAKVEQDGRERKLAALQEQQRQREAVRCDVELINDTLTRLQFEIDALAPVSGPDPAIAALRSRIEKGEAIIRDVSTRRHGAAGLRHGHHAQQTAAKALAEAERMVDRYGPKGARVAALEASLQDFHARINAALERFGYQLRIVADPWLVLVNGRPAAAPQQVRTPAGRHRAAAGDRGGLRRRLRRDRPGRPLRHGEPARVRGAARRDAGAGPGGDDARRQLRAARRRGLDVEPRRAGRRRLDGGAGG